MRASLRLLALLPLAALAAGALTLAAGCERGVLAPRTLEPLIVHAEGPWLRDRMGRVVLLRGINLSLADQVRLLAMAEGERTEVFTSLGALGFNLIRLQLPWRLLEPTPRASLTSVYSEHIDPILRLATAQGMVVVFSLRVGGRSAPIWAYRGREAGELDPRASWAPLPCDLLPPGDTSFAALMSAAKGVRAYANKAEERRRRRTPTSLGTRLARLWLRIADRYAYDVRIAGLDLIDEPLAGCPSEAAPVEQLLRFYTELALALRALHAGQTLLIEPSFTQGFPLPEGLSELPPPIAFAPHALVTAAPADPADSAGYTQAQEIEARVAAEASRAEKHAMALLVGEIGVTAMSSAGASADGAATPEKVVVAFDDERGRALTPALVEVAQAQLDSRLASGAFAAGAGRVTAQIGAPLHDESAAVRAALAHPFARRIAGVPTDLEFDRTSGTLALWFEDDPEHAPPDPTELFLPKHIFSCEPEVEVSGGGTWRFEPDRQRLLVYRGAGETHEVHVRPRQALHVPPPPARAAD